MSVFFHHSVITCQFYRLGVWRAANSRFYELLGPTAVLMFFFLSGYLFWAKSIADDGIPDIKAYFIARFRRILPLYCVVCSGVFLIVFLETGLKRNVPPLDLIDQLLQWLAIGVPSGFPAINGYADTPRIVASVFWSLRYEMMFYFCLPFLQWFRRGHRLWILAVGFGLLRYIPSVNFLIGFIFGMMTAYLQPMISERRRSFLKSESAACIALLPLIYLLLSRIEPYTLKHALLIWMPFIVITFGNTFGGVLTIRPMISLGKISYGVYLTHGLVLFVSSAIINRFIPIRDFSCIQFWIFTTLCGLMVLALSSFLHQNVERPFMHREKTAARILAA